MATKLWQLACLDQCTGREIWLAKPPMERESILPYPIDEDGYILCPFCSKILGRYQLSQCPDCGKFYKGYKPYPKYHFPCPDCE